MRLLSLLSLWEPVFAQEPLKDRIVHAVDTSQTTVVAGTLHPMARPEFDQGRVDPAMPMRVTINFKLTAAQQADLDELLAAQQQRGTPDYHRWLTPEQFGSRFGLSQGDINRVTTWLESQGFHIEVVPASRNMITFSGSTQMVESALHTEVHGYVVDGKAHFANASEPSVPTVLADVVMGFRGLNDFRLKPRMLRKSNPEFTSSVSGNHYMAPADFGTIYDVTPLYQQGFTGSGEKIAVVGQTDINLTDVEAFRSNSNLPANDPQKIFVSTNPGLQQGDIDEANLDVEWAGAIAYKATVIFIVGNPANGGVQDAINYAITTSPIPAPIISTSYGDCEADFPPDALSSLKSLMQQANAEGITVLGAAGDSGSADCDFHNNPSGPPVKASTHGLAVNLPGALESVTSIGGTEFTEGADTSHTYWTEAAGADVISSAHTYIPEGVWNDTNTTIGLAAGGGGSSTVIPKPAWQAGTGVPNDGARDVPDISFSSSSLHDGYLICSEKFNSTNNTFSPTCVSPFGFRDSAGGNLAVVGGTSVGPPVMSGIVALINQFTKSAAGSGNINPILYPLAERLPNSAFHDVTSGNNQVPFNPPCGASAQIGYGAGQGYDLATGLGSIDAFVLVTNWTSVAPASRANASTSADFSIAFAPNQISVKRGSCASGTVMLTRINGFAGTPSFTCMVPAALGSTTCAVVPAEATTGFGVPRSHHELGGWGLVGILLTVMAFAMPSSGRAQTGGRYSRATPRVAAGLMVVAILAIAGCGGGSNSSSNTNSGGNISSSAPQASYVLTVQAPSTAPVASAALTVSAAIGGINHITQITVTTQ